MRGYHKTAFTLSTSLTCYWIKLHEKSMGERRQEVCCDELELTCEEHNFCIPCVFAKIQNRQFQPQIHFAWPHNDRKLV